MGLLLGMGSNGIGIPVSLYTDRKTVYVPEEKVVERAKLTGESPFTQFGRAC